MNRRQKIALSSIALVLVGIVSVSVFVVPALADNIEQMQAFTNNAEQADHIFEVSTIKGEASLNGEVSSASIAFSIITYGEPIQVRNRTIRIFKVTEGSLTIGETTYQMNPETWEGIASMNGRRFVALGDVVEGENEFVLVLHGIAIAHFSDGTVFRVDGTLRGENVPNYHLIFLVLVTPTQ
ncbi:MAG: hypothetical protein QXD82_05750 [Nitrososphaerales archaeon]